MNIHKKSVKYFIIGEKRYNTTENGFLVNPNDWDRHFARFSARKNGIELTNKHWAWVYILHTYRSIYSRTPIEKAFLRFCKRRKHDTVEIVTLFGKYPNLVKISGLSRLNCGCIG